MASTRRKSAAVALAVVGIAGLSLASAATLNITPDTLQAGTQDLTGCQGTTAVTVDFTATWGTGQYIVDDVVLGAIAEACDGHLVEFTLLDSADAPLYSSTAANAADGSFQVPAASAVPAEAVEAISVVIHS